MMQTSEPNLFIGFILQSASTSSNYISFLIYNNNVSSYDYASNTQLFTDSNVHGSLNTWYHMKWELVNGELKYSVYNTSGTLLLTKTVTLPSVYSNINVYPSFVRYSTGGRTNRFRNVKVKPL